MLSTDALANRRPCSMQEIDRVRNHLARSNTPCLARHIDRGAAVDRADVVSAVAIGDLTTFFADLGGIQCQALGRERFLVREVVPVLRSPSCADNERLERVQRFKDLYRSGELELIVTLFEFRGLTIFDGNTRAIAVYESARDDGRANVVLPVFVVTAVAN